MFQLQEYSVQLMHHNITFTACGVFELSLPLIVSVRIFRGIL